MLDVNALAGLVGQSAWSAGRYWYAAKYPFATAMIPLYADNVMRILAAQMGRSRRVLVLDLDNTMWGGIVGDDGIEGLALGSGSALGEAHSALQRMALSLKERGIILCVSSKNDEAIALDAFRNHPEMILKEDDIVAFRVNWEDKAANIKAISEAIDLGLDSFVFLDDNPAERKRVRDALAGGRRSRIAGGSERLAAGVSGRGIFRAGRLFQRGPAARRLLQGERAARRAARADRRSRRLSALARNDAVDRAVRQRRPQADCAADLEVQPVQPDHPPLQRSRNRRAAVEARRLYGTGAP